MGDKTQLVYVALGGAGEIGMNMYCYGYGPAEDRRWIIVDCGVAFGDMSSAPGVDLVLADIDFIAAQHKRIDGIFITHAHEDHVGAIGRYWRRLRAPIYCTRFTAEIAKRKLEEVGLPDKHINVLAPHERRAVGPFDCAFFPVTHSVPDANALVIRTPLGVVFHSGDFKLDPDPGLGAPTDEAGLRAIGDEGVLCLSCDSTNVFEQGVSGAEASLHPGLGRVIREAEGAVAATTFASNVSRLRTLAQIARDADRSVVVVGRAMRRMIEAAVETGVLTDFPETVSEDEAKELPAEHVFYLVTGSQGEGRAALGRIANRSHPSVSLSEGDLVVYSSRTIPGNERDVYKVYNRLSEIGVQVVDADMADIHVSGHACRDELRRLYELLRPAYALPMHGEHRHLTEHARSAPEWGAADAVVAPNGAMVRLAEEDGAGGRKQLAPEVIEHVEAGRVYVDGEVLVGALDGVMRSRLRLARQGHVTIVMVVDEDGELIVDPEVRGFGLPLTGDDWPEPLEDMIAEAVDEALERLKPRDRATDDQIEEVAMTICRRICDKYWKKKPEITAVVVRLDEDEEEE